MSRARAVTWKLSLALLPYAVGAPLLTRMVDRSGIFGVLFVLPLAVATRLKGRRLGLWAAAVGIAANMLIWLTVGSGRDVLRSQPVVGIVGLMLEFAAFVSVVLGLDAWTSREDKYRALVESAPQGVAVVAEGRIVYLNPRFAEAAGYSVEEMRQMEISRLIHDDDVVGALENYRRQLDSRQPLEPTVVRFIHRHGDFRWVEAAGRLIRWDGRDAVMYMVSDITERKALESQLSQSVKMEAIGRLASGVAHDFGNILQVIMGYGSLMREHLHNTEELLNDIEHVEEAAGRATSLTQQLLTFARRRDARPTTIELTELVQRSEAMLDRILGEDVRLTVSLTDEPCWITVDPGQLEQVLLNLAVNARDAMPGGGALSISLRCSEAEVELSVKDTGCGMDEQTLSRVFEPFFTTKGQDQGTGLGLSIVYGIVKSNGGRVTVESAPGVGSRFIVTFPRAAAGAPAETPPDAEPERAGSGSVLVVEDDANVRRLVCRLLESGGYRVTGAETGERALEIVERTGGAFDLLLADLVMPGMDGTELASVVRRHHPGVRIMFMTGHTYGRAVRQSRGELVLHKPFSAPQLLSTVKKAIARTE